MSRVEDCSRFRADIKCAAFLRFRSEEDRALAERYRDLLKTHIRTPMTVAATMMAPNAPAFG